MNRRTEIRSKLVLGLFLLFPLLGCASTFSGRIIDCDTREPIEGTVVVAYWYEAWGTFAGEATRLKDVKETLTDKEGKWSIRGPKGRPSDSSNDFIVFLTGITGIPYTRQPDFIVFKPGILLLAASIWYRCMPRAKSN